LTNLPLRLSFGPADGGQQQGRQRSNDGDDDQKLDQRKRLTRQTAWGKRSFQHSFALF
jgi:hypothetical protein